MVETHFDWMAKIKAVWPLWAVFSGDAPQERREETVSSCALRAAYISGVIPFLVFGCKNTLMIHIDYDNAKDGRKFPIFDNDGQLYEEKVGKPIK